MVNLMVIGRERVLVRIVKLLLLAVQRIIYVSVCCCAKNNFTILPFLASPSSRTSYGQVVNFSFCTSPSSLWPQLCFSPSVGSGSRLRKDVCFHSFLTISPLLSVSLYVFSLACNLQLFSGEKISPVF